MGLATESVKTTFSILKKYPKILILTLILALLGQLPQTLPLLYQLLLVLLTFFFSLLFGAAVQLIVKDALLSKTVSLLESLSFGLKKIHKILGLTSLLMLIAGIILLPIIFTIFLLTIPYGFWISSMLVIAATLVVVYISTRLAFATPILMIENLGIIESLKKSWGVSRNRFWSIVGAFTLLGLLLVPYLITAVVFSVFQTETVSAGLLLTQFLVLIVLSMIPSTLLSLLPATYYLKIKGKK